MTVVSVLEAVVKRQTDMVQIYAAACGLTFVMACSSLSLFSVTLFAFSGCFRRPYQYAS